MFTSSQAVEAEPYSISWNIGFTALLCSLLLLLPDILYADGVDNVIGDVFCTVRLWFTGNVGKGLATIAITIIGIGALLGKVSWGMAMIVGVGVAIVFGAASIVDTIGVETSTCTITTAKAAATVVTTTSAGR